MSEYTCLKTDTKASKSQDLLVRPLVTPFFTSVQPSVRVDRMQEGGRLGPHRASAARQQGGMEEHCTGCLQHDSSFDLVATM